MTTIERLRALLDEHYGHHRDCALTRYPGSWDQPPDPCTCYGPEMAALLDVAAEAIRQHVPSLHGTPDCDLCAALDRLEGAS